MRHARQKSLGQRQAVVRSILTAGLLLCVLSGALPAEAVLNPFDSMPCCRGMKGAAGECHGNSCPMHLRARAKSARRVQRDPVCGAGRLLKASAGEARRPEEVQNVRQGSSRQTFAGAASLGSPCPSECCGGAAASFAGLRRQRNHAALNSNLRPRPPNPESHRPADFNITETAFALRRLHPPRAPPKLPDTRTA